MSPHTQPGSYGHLSHDQEAEERIVIPPVSSPSPGFNDHLLDQAIQKFLNEYSGLNDAQKAALIDILQADLASGRISRRLKGHVPDHVDEFLTAYVTSVAAYYLAENPSLVALQAGDHDAWHNLMSWLERCAYAKLQRLNMLNSLPGYTFNDFAQETSLWMLNAVFELDLPSPYSPAVGLAIGYPYDVVFLAWIAKVQSNHISDAIRQHGRHKWEQTIDEMDEQASTEDGVELAIERLAVKQGISRLTLYQQETIEQLYVQGMDVQGAARRLGCTDQAVYKRKLAALSRLRHELQESR